MKSITIDKDWICNSYIEQPSDIGSITLQCEILFSDARGRYIPRDFAEDGCLENCFNSMGKSQDELDRSYAILMNPEHEWYWDEWSSVIDNAYWIDADKIHWTFDQDGDLFMIARLHDNRHILSNPNAMASLVDQIVDQYDFDRNEVIEELEALRPVPYIID